MKIRFEGRNLEVRIRARTFHQAYAAAQHVKYNPPAGYKLVASEERRRDRNSDRCDLRIFLIDCDPLTPRLTREDVEGFFSPIEEKATAKD